MNTNNEMYKIIITTDGSNTIYYPNLDEHYHSIHGAVQESTIIFINNGFDICKSDPLNIFEVGLGTGLNVTLYPGPPGKRQISRATKILNKNF